MAYLIAPSPTRNGEARRTVRVVSGGQKHLALGGPYKGGEINRLNKTWVPAGFSGDGAIGLDWDLLTRRIRDLQRNDPAIIALRRAIVDHVVGMGIASSATVMIGDAADSEMDEEFNFEADAWFEDWAEQDADIEGRLSWPDMQRQLLGEVLDCGEAILLRCASPDPDRPIPLCYQTLEAEQIDSSKDQPRGKSQNEIRRGIELDRYRRPVAYWLFEAHPDDPHSGYSGSQSVRVPADRVLHFIAPGRPSQTRGISLYGSITQSARDLDNYLGAELTAANIGALFTLVHKTGNPGSGFGFVGDGTDSSGSDANGNPLARLGRGIVAQVHKDDEIEQVEAKRPNRDARVFTDLILLMLSMGGGISKYRLTRDYSGTTYVSARAAHMDDRACFRPLQGYVGRRLVLPVRREWTAQMAAYGQLRSISATQFARQRRRWQRVTLQPPGWEATDPEKETDSDLASIGGGFATLESVNARRGQNWRRVILQREREIAFAKKHHVELNYDRPSTPGKKAAEEQPETQATR